MHVIWLIAGRLELTLANHALYEQAHGFELAGELALETMVGHLLLIALGVRRAGRVGARGLLTVTLGAARAPRLALRVDGKNCARSVWMERR